MVTRVRLQAAAAAAGRPTARAVSRRVLPAGTARHGLPRHHSEWVAAVVGRYGRDGGVGKTVAVCTQ